MFKRSFQPAVIAAVLLGSLGVLPAAHAEGLYVGGSVGSQVYRDDVNSISAKGSGASGKLYGGYQFTPNFALEAGLTYLGHSSNDGAKVDGRGEYLDLVGLAPLGDKWSLLGSVGMAHVNLDTSNGDDSGNGLKLGLGAQYALTNHVSLRGEWEHYHPDAFGEKLNIDQFTIGAHLGF